MTNAFDDDNQSSKSFLLPSKSTSSSPAHKKYNRQIVPLTPDDTPPIIPSRKPSNKKTNAQTLSPTSNNLSVFNSSFEVKPINNKDDISLPNSRRLSNKEVRRKKKKYLILS